ncbi:tetratricopeptide repeat protein [Actinospica sp. MGRD01-02]|uniref:Tetratricopeptide repeat protein n=1 Tax=Actinospica acidithermotolerans TaxID=2828514 RepID=A0A941EAY0_9ACTN|nr:tetratricopeptide repeat protein [Actinospica acidithermotolerans]
MIVVAGTAGAGKTALTMRLAHQLRERYPDGQLFVNLHGYDTGPPLAPARVLDRFLRALGVAPQAVPTELEERAELYRSLLAGRRMLVVLDNAATAGQIRPLLPGEPECLVLVTSRSRLSALAARDGAQRVPLGLLPEAEAVALVETSIAGRRGTDDPAQVAELARLCAYLPLALRIAAERAAARPWMPLRALIEDLRDESGLWDALTTEDGEEADAVRAVFAWSYRVLPPAAARAFRRLGLHPGPHFAVPAAAAVTDQQPDGVSALLDLLVGAHLLEQTGAQRYQFHDLLRAYAADQARREESPDEQRAALTRLAAWYLHSTLAALRAAGSFNPPQLGQLPESAITPMAFDTYDAALSWHRAEQANLLAVVRAAAAAGLDQLAWQLPAALHGLNVAHNPLDDWTQMATIGIDAAQRLGDRRAQALLHESLGIAHAAAGRLEPAAAEHRAALTLRSELADPPGVAASAHNLGLVHLQRRELDQALANFEQTLDFAKQPGNEAWQAPALCCLAYVHAEAGDLEPAARLAEQSLAELANRSAAAYLRVDPLLLLARIDRETSRYDRATAHLDQAAAVVEQLDHPALEHAVLLERAELARARGEHERALELYWQYQNQQRSVGDPTRQALAYDGAGLSLQALGRLEEAIEFHLAATLLNRHPVAPWQLSASLSHLADALERNAEIGRAEAARAEAYSLLEPFVDRRATALREHVRRLRQSPTA